MWLNRWFHPAKYSSRNPTMPLLKSLIIERPYSFRSSTQALYLWNQSWRILPSKSFLSGNDSYTAQVVVHGVPLQSSYPGETDPPDVFAGFGVAEVGKARWIDHIAVMVPYDDLGIFQAFFFHDRAEVIFQKVPSSAV